VTVPSTGNGGALGLADDLRAVRDNVTEDGAEQTLIAVPASN